jgi:hypothetical protein
MLQREVEPARTTFARADAVLPLVPRDEVAARVANERRPELAPEREHVAPEAVLVGAGVAGLVEAAVDATTDVLDEGAEQPTTGFADHRIAPDRDGEIRSDAARRIAPAMCAGILDSVLFAATHPKNIFPPYP